jgi:Protein of unknown function (DUF1592)/Protein of unknown function (DUF1588)/Protein of unknown function (DUF1595)/Protein of unknown function (DUF1587)/Protein of unknown function (DUF1585)
MRTCQPIAAALATLMLACAGSGDGSRSNGGAGGIGGIGPICSGGDAGSVDLRRLTVREYRNTIEALFPGMALPPFELASDISVQGFDNQSAGQRPSDDAVHAFFAAARIVASAAIANPAVLLGGCAPEAVDCRERFLNDFASRAFRRPLDPVEVSSYLNFMETQVGKYGALQGLRMLIESLLVAPEFLYRPEPQADGFAMATRLSFALWQSPPDAELLQAASEGKLSATVGGNGLVEQVDRMMRDPRARVAIADFHRQWLQLDRILTAQRDSTLFPEYKPDSPRRLYDSTRAFIDQTYWDAGGSIDALLTRPVVPLDASLAGLYGLAGVTSDTLVPTQLDVSERGGLLTQVGMMAALSGPLEESPIHRGLFVLEHFLCEGLPPPPMVVPTLPPRVSPEGNTTTVRARIEKSHSPPACQSCHFQIDPFGFAFGHYDALGRYRATDSGIPIDTRGVVRDGADGVLVYGDFRAEFNDAIDLSSKLAKSQRVLSCVGENLFRFTVGRIPTDAERCELGKLAAASNGSTQVLLVKILSSGLFRQEQP